MPSPCPRAFACLGSALAALLLSPVPARAGWELDYELIGQVADQLGFDTNELDLASLRIANPAEWNSFWAGIEEGLRGGSLETLARLRPCAEASLTYLDKFPQAAPCTSWLRERLDYLAVAEEVLKAEPEAHYEPPPPPAPSSWKLPPPARLPRPPPGDVVVRKTGERSRGEEIWRKRLEKRAAPARAAELTPLLKRVFAAEGVPPQLVWLAEVESSMNPNARSPVGAVGLFQLMPATARHLGLSTSPIDERKNAEKNARAAARYLRQLRGRFSTWSLALAAYNAGEGRVGGLLKKHQAASFEEIAESLPVETRLYVPKLRALLMRRENVALDSLPARG